MIIDHQGLRRVTNIFQEWRRSPSAAQFHDWLERLLEAMTALSHSVSEDIVRQIRYNVNAMAMMEKFSIDPVSMILPEKSRDMDHLFFNLFLKEVRASGDSESEVI